MSRGHCDPKQFKALYWPHVEFYSKQWDAIYSVHENDETYIYAAHQMGKDFLAGFTVLWYFLGTDEQCRIVTTSVKDDHLRVLWGEIGRYIDTAVRPIRYDKGQGGQLVVTHRELRKVMVPKNGGQPTIDKISYVKGMVSEKGEGMAGHHAHKTLLVVDEASGVDEIVVERASSWAKKSLIFGNPYGGTSSWFAKSCLGGDVAYDAAGSHQRDSGLLVPNHLP